MKTRRLLYPFSLIYGLIMLIRRALYHKRLLNSQTLAISTICIGNLRVGGTGKTPHAEYLIRLLSPQHKVGFLSRGYGRKSRGAFLAEEFPPKEITSSSIGDEPMQIYQKFPDIKVAVAEQRVLGLQRLMDKHPDTEIVLLDDAYQHLAINSGLKILLTEYADPYYNDLPFPAGNLREFPLTAKEADIILVTKSPKKLADSERETIRKRLKLQTAQHCFYTIYIYSDPIPENDEANVFSLQHKTKIILLTGIARPEPLYAHLAEKYEIVKHFQFRDHYQYTVSDIDEISTYIKKQQIENIAIITTEKDYARWNRTAIEKELSHFPIFTVGIEVRFLFDEEEKFNTLIKEYVRKNTKHSTISE